MTEVHKALAIALLLAVALVTAGVWLLSPAIALIVCGAGVATVAVVMASEVASAGGSK